RLIAENVVNVDTPGYQQKDLSLEKFQALLRDRVDRRRDMPSGGADGSAGAFDVGAFDDVAADVQSPRRGILFHDGNNRSMEQLMADQARNAMMHNLAVELLRKQFQ